MTNTDSRRTARIRTHFIEAGTTVTGGTTHRDYVVEIRQGQVRQSLGRIMGSVRGGRGLWAALPVGADAWTGRHTTRAGALAALAAREDWQLTA